MVVKQIDLIDVEQAAVGLGQQAWLECTNSFAEGLLDVDGAAETIFSGTERQIHHRDLSRLSGQAFTMFNALAHVTAL